MVRFQVAGVRAGPPPQWTLAWTRRRVGGKATGDGGRPVITAACHKVTARAKMAQEKRGLGKVRPRRRRSQAMAIGPMRIPGRYIRGVRKRMASLRIRPAKLSASAQRMQRESRFSMRLWIMQAVRGQG